METFFDTGRYPKSRQWAGAAFTDPAFPASARPRARRAASIAGFAGKNLF